MKSRSGSVILPALGVMLVLALAAAIAVPVLTCPRCDGDAAVAREVLLKTGRAVDPLLCRICGTRGRVTAIQRVLFGLNHGGYGPPRPHITLEPLDR